MKVRGILLCEKSFTRGGILCLQTAISLQSAYGSYRLSVIIAACNDLSCANRAAIIDLESQHDSYRLFDHCCMQ